MLKLFIVAERNRQQNTVTTVFYNKDHVFQDRRHAGEFLAEGLREYSRADLSILAIPNGGVPVAFPIFEKFHKEHRGIEFHLLIVRKIPIPYNTEAGFGAITMDGTMILNEPLVARIGLTDRQIQAQAASVLQEMKERLRIYGLQDQEFHLKNRIALLIDDGLASGYTMIAAIESIKKYTPSQIIVAIPTAPKSSIDRLAPLVDKIICLNIRDTMYFAVADAYKNWYDLEFEEVQSLLKEIQVRKA